MTSMDIKKLFKGIAVVIDDDIHNQDSSIYNILNQLKAESIPYVEYDSLPDKKVVDNLQNVSFVLLDWKLETARSVSEIISGVQTPAEYGENSIKENIDFLKAIQKVCFCPIFIFTDEDVSDIFAKLEEEKLYKSNSCSNILVKAKSEFRNSNSLFENLEKWIKSIAPIYLLKAWDSAYQIAKNNLFIDFQNRSPFWVKILWNTYKKDGVDPSIELEEFITKSIQTQSSPLQLDNTLFESLDDTNDSKELIDCLERQSFVNTSFIDKDKPDTGDVFIISGTPYINIRPCCDLVPRSGKNVDDVELYLLRGEKTTNQEKINNKYLEEYGHFNDNDTCFTVYPICSGYLITFKFKELKIQKWSEIKDKRKGRLLHPYLTKLQMKYGAYIQRQGLPRMPDELFIKQTKSE